MITTETKADTCLTDRLQRRAAATCAKILDLCGGSTSIAAELESKFHAAVVDVEQVTIETLMPQQGAFAVENGVLRIAEEPVSRLLSFVLEDIRGQEARSRPLAPEEIAEMIERVFVDYVLHELRHRTQGIEKYSDVSALKLAAGPAAMTEFDVLADRDAAFAFAAIHAEGDSRADFLESFKEALFLSSAYFFRVFRPSADRPDKLARAIAVLLMAARLSGRDFEDPIVDRDDLRLDAPLYATLSSGQNQLAIYKVEPSKKFLGLASDSSGHGVSELVADVRDGAFDSALERSVTLMSQLNLL